MDNVKINQSQCFANHTVQEPKLYHSSIRCFAFWKQYYRTSAIHILFHIWKISLRNKYIMVTHRGHRKNQHDQEILYLLPLFHFRKKGYRVMVCLNFQFILY